MNYPNPGVFTDKGNSPVRFHPKLAASVAAAAAVLSMCAAAPVAAQITPPTPGSTVNNVDATEPFNRGLIAHPASAGSLATQTRVCHTTYTSGASVYARNGCRVPIRVNWTTINYSPRTACLRPYTTVRIGSIWNTWNARTHLVSRC